MSLRPMPISEAAIYKTVLDRYRQTNLSGQESALRKFGPKLQPRILKSFSLTALPLSLSPHSSPLFPFFPSLFSFFPFLYLTSVLPLLSLRFRMTLFFFCFLLDSPFFGDRRRRTPGVQLRSFQSGLISLFQSEGNELEFHQNAREGICTVIL